LGLPTSGSGDRGGSHVRGIKNSVPDTPLRRVGQYLAVTSAAESVEQIYLEHRDRLWRALLGYTSDPEIASDALAEAFVQALARDGDLRSPADWVWTASFRIARGMLKDHGRNHAREEEPRYELPESVKDLVQALAAISERQRLAIVLHDYGDRPTSEVAAVLGISTATVHVHLSNGRRRLRNLLEDRDA
jgi:RNA polymerase sigma-70 factor, ECF subfamily